MSKANLNYDISVVSAPPGQWTPIVATIGCSAFSIFANGDINISPDSGGAGSQKLLSQGVQEYSPPSSGERWSKGTTLFYVQPTGGSTLTVTATFLL